jgi:hypothetical protein
MHVHTVTQQRLYEQSVSLNTRTEWWTRKEMKLFNDTYIFEYIAQFALRADKISDGQYYTQFL